MRKVVVAEGPAALEPVALAPEQREPAQQGLVAAKEERVRPRQAAAMLLVVGRRPERSGEARRRERSAVERLLTGQIALHLRPQDRCHLNNKRRPPHPPVTRPPLAVL